MPPLRILEEAKVMLYEWRKGAFKPEHYSCTTIQSSENFKSRSEYVEHVPLKNDFQFLDVGRYDPIKKILRNEKLIL